MSRRDDETPLEAAERGYRLFRNWAIATVILCGVWAVIAPFGGGPWFLRFGPAVGFVVVVACLGVQLRRVPGRGGDPAPGGEARTPRQ